MPNQPTDPIISEVIAVCDSHAARFGYDFAAIFRNTRAMQDEFGREYVRFPVRPVVISDHQYDWGDARASGYAEDSTKSIGVGLIHQVKQAIMWPTK